jgi:hypothetical protein
MFVYSKSKHHNKFIKILIYTAPLPHERLLPFGDLTLPSSVRIASLNTHQRAVKRDTNSTDFGFIFRIFISLYNSRKQHDAICSLDKYISPRILLFYLHEELPISISSKINHHKLSVRYPLLSSCSP